MNVIESFGLDEAVVVVNRPATLIAVYYNETVDCPMKLDGFGELEVKCQMFLILDSLTLSLSFKKAVSLSSVFA